MKTEKKYLLKITKVIIILLLCVITLCAQECDTSWIGEVAGAAMATGLTILGMDSQKAKEIGAALFITGAIVETIRSTTKNYDPGVSQAWVESGLVAQNNVIENRRRQEEKQEERQARIEEIRVQNEQDRQEIIARFEPSLPRGTSSVTSPASEQNIGNPQTNNLATNNGVVMTARSRSRSQGTGAQRTGGNITFRPQQTTRNDQSANPNAANITESRREGAPGVQNYRERQTSVQGQAQTTSGTQQPTDSTVARVATTPQPTPQMLAATIAEYTPQTRRPVPSPNPTPMPESTPGTTTTPTPSSSRDNNINTHQLSGAHWVDQFPGSNSISDLVSPFKENVQDFVNALREAGATVTESATLRPQNRALLMHYCWRIANRGFNPQNVPTIPGVDIIWVHKDTNGNYSRELSIQAARNMASAYKISPDLDTAPATTSRHISGLAIDMNIRWENLNNDTRIYIKNKSGQTIEVERANKNRTYNANLDPTIIEVGRTYGVIKFHIPEKDPVHWSNDGR
jgi:hypothetical protein